MRIQNPSFFSALLSRLSLVYQGEPFELPPVVMPVSLVDTGVTIEAVASTPVLGTPSTEGDKVAPAADTLLADTGAQSAGDFVATINVFANEANSFLLQRRNAANTANIWQTRLRWSDAGKPMAWLSFRCRLEASERLRIVNEGAGGGGTTYAAHIWLNAA